MEDSVKLWVREGFLRHIAYRSPETAETDAWVDDKVVWGESRAFILPCCTTHQQIYLVDYGDKKMALEASLTRVREAEAFFISCRYVFH